MASQEIPNFTPNNIFAAVSQLGIVGKCPSLDADFHGGECRVFKLSFEDKASVAVRVPHPNPEISQNSMIATVQIEAGILKSLEEKGFPWTPRCFGTSLTFDNPIKHPFIVSTWAEGLPLSSCWDEESPPRPVRDSLLGQLASIQRSLLECTIQNGMSSTQMTRTSSHHAY